MVFLLFFFLSLSQKLLPYELNQAKNHKKSTIKLEKKNSLHICHPKHSNIHRQRQKKNVNVLPICKLSTNSQTLTWY